MCLPRRRRKFANPAPFDLFKLTHHIDFPVSCEGTSVCGYNTFYRWWGCCGSVAYTLGTDVFVTDCPIITACVNFENLYWCDNSCIVDTMVLKWYASLMQYFCNPGIR